jgi:hypothetical protein
MRCETHGNDASKFCLQARWIGWSDALVSLTCDPAIELTLRLHLRISSGTPGLPPGRSPAWSARLVCNRAARTKSVLHSNTIRLAATAHVSNWRRAEDLGGATTSAAFWGYNRYAQRIDAMPACDPYLPSVFRECCDAAFPCAHPPRRWYCAGVDFDEAVE